MVGIVGLEPTSLLRAGDFESPVVTISPYPLNWLPLLESNQRPTDYITL